MVLLKFIHNHTYTIITPKEVHKYIYAYLVYSAVKLVHSEVGTGAARPWMG